MTKSEQKFVKQWLYSIPKTEVAIKNLERAIDDLSERRQSPPTWMSNPDALGVQGGSGGSKQETWVEFLDMYEARMSYLQDTLARHKRKIEQYNDTLEAMNNDVVGALGVAIIKYKYYRHIKPDSAIYTLYLFCSQKTFYNYHFRALQYFAQTLPDIFHKI